MGERLYGLLRPD